MIWVLVLSFSRCFSGKDLCKIGSNDFGKRFNVTFLRPRASFIGWRCREGEKDATQRIDSEDGHFFLLGISKRSIAKDWKDFSKDLQRFDCMSPGVVGVCTKIRLLKFTAWHQRAWSFLVDAKVTQCKSCQMVIVCYIVQYIDIYIYICHTYTIICLFFSRSRELLSLCNTSHIQPPLCFFPWA